jgi:hypothetical protein
MTIPRPTLAFGKIAWPNVIRIQSIDLSNDETLSLADSDRLTNFDAIHFLLKIIFSGLDFIVDLFALTFSISGSSLSVSF